MTGSTSTDHWRRYWERLHDSGRRLRVENAARDPLSGWLTAEVPTLVDDHELDPSDLRDRPDAVLEAGRDGFAAFVDDEGLARPDDDRYGYEVVPVHLTGATRVTDAAAPLEAPVDDVNRLTHVTAVPAETPRTSLQPAVLTYRCPRDHETTIRQSMYRTWTLETCSRKDCTNAVVPEDRRTRVRRITEFSVEVGDRTLSCVATGQYARETRPRQRIVDADRLRLTGIPRLVTDERGAVEPLYEVLHAEPA